ncbi:isoamylase early set domain-containing protein [Streptomyces sp. NPDC093093]|uniref:isoamylase early set domain-containing protein n=1 Tax=Streptomyces sp. NPDC093093 TaxID=3366025 RepID=UPI0038305D4A
MLEQQRRKDQTDVTFVLPADTPPGPVSVVGDFNEWKPGTHELAPRPDGTRAVTVTLPAKASHSFRYLAAGDYWFNDDSAEGHDGNSRLTT